jgi:hypothetical protein
MTLIQDTMPFLRESFSIIIPLFLYICFTLTKVLWGFRVLDCTMFISYLLILKMVTYE